MRRTHVVTLERGKGKRGLVRRPERLSAPRRAVDVAQATFELSAANASSLTSFGSHAPPRVGQPLIHPPLALGLLPGQVSASSARVGVSVVLASATPRSRRVARSGKGHRPLRESHGDPPSFRRCEPDRLFHRIHVEA
jgi:hypothetical protein